MHAEISSIEIIHKDAIISSDGTETKSPSDGSHLFTVTVHKTPGNGKGKVFKQTKSCVCIQLPLRYIESKKVEKRFWTFKVNGK